MRFKNLPKTLILKTARAKARNKRKRERDKRERIPGTKTSVRSLKNR